MRKVPRERWRNMAIPTFEDKVILVDFSLIETNAFSLQPIDTQRQFSTTDRGTAFIGFKSENITNGMTADISLANLDDDSRVNRTFTVTTGTNFDATNKIFYYQIPDDEIVHWGNWIGYGKFTDGATSKTWTGTKLKYSISRDITNDPETKLIVMEDVNSFIASMQSIKSEMEADHAQAILDQTNYAGLLENGVMTTQIIAKLTELETTYAPDLFSVKQQLAETQAEIDAAVGAMTVDSEVVVARSEYTTLGNRLNDLTAKKSDIKDKYYQINAPGDFTVFLPLGENEYGGYRFNRDATPTEDFIKMHENSVFEKSGGNQDVETTMNYGTISGGSMLATATNNHYTTTIGTKLTTLFTGYKVQLRFYTRYDGGLWNVKIDGVDYGNISVWNASLVTGETKTYLIADELPNVEHTVVIEYLGADPAHPATTSDGVTPTKARGWISSNTTGDTTKYTFVTNKIEYVAIAMVKKFDLSEGFSNKEYAFEVRPAGTTDASEWFPAHLGIATTFLQTDGVQDLIIDGVMVDIETAGLVTPFKDGQFVQYMYQKMSTDTENRAKIKLLITFGETVKQYFEMAFLLPTEIKNGYVFQMPMMPDYLSRKKKKKREIKLTDTVNLGTNEYFANLTAREFIASSSFADKKDYFLRCKMTNSSHGLDNLYLQHRVTTALQKLYPKVFNYTTIVAGAKVWFDGEYEVGKLKNADIVYG